MDSEFKRAMKLMWGNKRMRKTFGCDFGLVGNGGGILLVVLFTSVPLWEALLGKQLKDSVEHFLLTCAVLVFFCTELYMTQCVYAGYGKVGRGFGSFPMSKSIMTKGIMVNLLAFFLGYQILVLGMHGICVAVGAVGGELLDDIVFTFGLQFFNLALFHVVFSKMNPFYASGMVSSGAVALVFSTTFNVIGEMELSIGWALGWNLGFTVVGGIIYYVFLHMRYRARSTVNPME